MEFGSQPGQFLPHDVRADHREPAAFGQAAGQGRFARTGQAADEHECRPPGRFLQFAERQEPVRPRSSPRRGPFLLGNLLLAELESLDLAAHRRPVGGVERQQLCALRVAGRLEVRVGERLGQVAPAAEDEVHDQERRVGDRVGEAEPLVELDAVDDDEIVRRLRGRGSGRRGRGAGRRACRAARRARPATR